MGNGKKTGKQPYIPLYIGDWEQDTNMLSLEAEAAWLKIIFKMFKNGKTGIYKTSTKALQNLWRKEVVVVLDILNELDVENVCIVNREKDEVTFTNRRMEREYKISKIRSNAVQSRYKHDTSVVQPLEYDNEYSNTYIQKTLSMLIPEMMKIWYEKKPDYLPEKEIDYPACLQIAYRISDINKWKKAEVVDEKEKEVLSEWSKVADFIVSDSWFRKLTLDTIATAKMWQKILNAIATPSNNGKEKPIVNGLEAAREEYRKSQLK